MAMDNATAHEAADYDGKVRQTIPFYDEIHRQVLELVADVVPEPACWLDTGCGTGTLVRSALARFPRTSFVLADPSPAMLDRARTRLGDEPRLSILAPAGTVELPDVAPHPQVVTAIMCHHYLQPDARLAALQRCRALLAPGGLLVAFENVSCDTLEGTRLGLERWGRWQREVGRPDAVVREHLARFGRELLPLRVEEHLSVLRAAGFRVVEQLWRSYMQAGFYALV